ncbi:MAG: hypothetical protein J0M12_13670 [Deltaproteobacteria bacterium]|nr:hypothetical protein [Deltaproteobacteria bacterium]
MNIFKSAYWSLLSLALPAQVFAIVPLPTCQSTVEEVGCRTLLITTCNNSPEIQCQSTINMCGNEPCIERVRGINCQGYGHQLDGLRLCNEVYKPLSIPTDPIELPGLDELLKDFDFGFGNCEDDPRGCEEL